MYAHTIRFLLYVSFLLATGCSDTSNPLGSTGVPSSSFNTVLFDPTTSTVPLPNILATATAKDPLTQYTDATGSVVARPANTPMTPPEALAYINKYEMASTNAVAGVNAPVYIRFSSPLKAATVTADNIKVFQLAPDTASSSSTENNPLGFTDISTMFEFKYTSGSNDLFLFPKFPLMPATRYLYVVTNRVKDYATGGSVSSSVYFEALKSTLPLVGSFAALEAIRADVKASNGTDIKLSGYAKVMNDLIAASATTSIASRKDIALLGRFITTGAGFVSSDAVGTMMPVESALRAFAAGAGMGGLPGKNWANSITVTATFDRGGTNPAPDAYWSGVMGAATVAPTTVNSIISGTINSALLSIDPVIARANSGGIDLTGVTSSGLPAFNPAAGVVQPFRDGTGALTGYYHTTSAVPFVYIAPTGVPPVDGWPLVIFQHGITKQKETVIAVAGSLTAAGYAVVAIDLPLHGELKVTGHATEAEWGQDFMAVGAPLAARSNIQQAAFNLNRLEMTLLGGGFAGLGADAPNRTTVKAKFVGISLGSIVGAYYLAGNTTLSATGVPYGQDSLNSDMKGLLSVPGGRVAYLLVDSPAFGTSIIAGLAAKGVVAGTPTYHQFFQVTQSVMDPVDPATMTTPLASGLPSRLSGRIVIQEATGGDLVIPNANTRYFGNALGGRAVSGAAGAVVAPGFKQLGYNGSSAPVSAFMAPFAVAATSAADTTPTEGYFQFNQTGVSHGFLLDPTASPLATGLAQRQMVYYLKLGIVVDPTVSGAALPKTAARMVPGLAGEVLLPPVLKIFGY